MPRAPVKIKLSKEERELLKQNLKPRTQYRFVQRTKIILLAEKRLSNDAISKKVGLSFVSVSKWRNRYEKYGIVGLQDSSRSGKPKEITHDQIIKIVEVACQTPDNETHWSLRRLADKLKFVKKSRLQQILKNFDLKPHQSKMWCFSNDPKYEEKKSDVVGLYLNPPKNAFVICIDEKTQIQALSRKIKPMKKGHAEKRSDRYKRNGTVDLFAAFRVNDGKVIGKIEERHRAIEFLKFVKIVYRKWGQKKKEMHFVMDNFSTHEVEEVKQWKEKHKNVTFHFTPTHASWLNQIELWFSILKRQMLSRGSFESEEILGEKILEFIEKYNKKSKPFAWSYGEPLKI